MDVDYLLDLFDDDATVYEPFSSSGIVSGQAEIESFLKVFCKYSTFVTDMKTVKVSRMKNAPNSTTAIVNLKKGGGAKFALDFSFTEPHEERKGKTANSHPYREGNVSQEMASECEGRQTQFFIGLALKCAYLCLEPLMELIDVGLYKKWIL